MGTFQKYVECGVLKRILVLLVLAFALASCGQDQQELQLHGTDITQSKLKGEFSLMDHEGRQRQLGDFKGKVVVVVFGYTHCPDVCPTMLLSMAGAMKLLGDKAQDVQVLFVTVDPGRDTQDVLAQYVPFFDSRFIGLYGTEKQVQQVAKNYRVAYKKQYVEGGGYTVDHSAGVYVLDREGHVRAYLRHDETPAQLAEDITHFF